MAEILQARVEQKIDTEANWLANPLVLLSGECAFVLSSDGTHPVNFKIGDGTKTFSQLPYWIDYAANVVVPTVAPGGTLPAPTAGKLIILAAGTYTQPGGGTITAPADAFNVYFFDGTVWSLVVSIPVVADLSNYYTKAQSLQLLYDNIGSAVTSITVLETITKSAATYRYTGVSASGWGFNIGTPQGFNKATCNIRGKAANSSNITSVIARIVDESDGSVLATSSPLTVSIAPGANLDLVFSFSSIPNASSHRLFMQVAANGLIDILGNGSDSYPQGTWYFNSYATNSAANFTTPFTNVSGSANQNIWALIENAVTSVSPSPTFSEAVAANSTTIQANKTAVTALQTTKLTVDSAMTYGDLETSGADIFSESLATFRDISSTYSGWGAPVGVRANFNTVKIRVEARSTNTVNITRIRFFITQNDKDGTILADKIVTGLSIAPGASQYVSVTFDTTISPGSTPLFLLYKADQYVDLYGLSGGSTIPYPNPTYGNYAYTAGSSTTVDTITPTTYTLGSSPTTAQRNIWARFSLVSKQAIPTTIFTNQILAGYTPPATPTLKSLVTVSHVIPSLLNAVEGSEFNIWFDNAFYCNTRGISLSYDVTCTKGYQLDKNFRFLPVAADAGDVSIQIDVYFEDRLITTATSTIRVRALSNGSGVTRSVVMVGDSYINNGTIISTITSERSSDVTTLNFKGTLGVAPNKNEGRSGWRMSDYVTAGRTLYKFVVSGVTTAPGLASVYSDGTSTYLVQEVNITAGSGYFSGELQSGGPGTPAASGNLTKVSGSGQTTIAYSSFSQTPGNAFWNGSALSLTNYMSTNSITLAANDWIILEIGINDVFSSTDANIVATLNTFITNMRTFLTAMHAGVSGLRCGIFITNQGCYNQDGFGKTYGNGQNWGQYYRNIKALQARLITEFDNSTERTAGNYLIPTHLVLDRENSFAKSTVGASAREQTVTVQQYTNGVHPATSGYQQISDQVFAFLKVLI